MNYEKEKVHDLFINQKLNKYYIEILPANYKYFSNIDLPDELILEMLKQKNLSYKNLIGILSYLPSIEKVLSTINNNCDIISNCCIKEKQKLNILEIAHPKEIDNLYKTINKIERILNYQLKNKKEFISFDQQFWNYYIQYNGNKNLKNLLRINKAMLLYKKINKSFNPDNLEIKLKIHNTALSLIEKGELKNEEVIKFINKDIYFKDKKYESKDFRSLNFLKGIDLEKADDKFFKKWIKSNIFKIYSFIDYEFKEVVINKINDMKDFGKLLKLFNYKNNKIFNDNTCNLLYEKFKNLIKTYRIETCPNFIQDISLFIYIYDKKFKDVKHFLKNIIETNIKSNQTLNDIYIYLTINYNDISKDVINTIDNYFSKNKDKENFLNLLRKMNSINLILNSINSRHNNIIYIIEYLKKLLEMYKEFYEIMHQDNIKLIINFKKQINEEIIKNIKNIEIKSKIEEMYKNLPDYDKKAKLKLYKFINYFDNKKANNLIQKEDIFKEKEDFNKIIF